MTQPDVPFTPLVELIPIGDLAPYERNPRLIPDAAIDAVADSIERFGFLQPIVVDDDMSIAAGHTRHLAAQKLGLLEVPVIRAGHLTPEQIRAYRLSDNRTGEYSGWNLDMLSAEVVLLDEAPLPGFEDNELAVLRTFVHFLDDAPPLLTRPNQLPKADDTLAPLTVFVPKEHLVALREKFDGIIKETVGTIRGARGADGPDG